MLGRRGRSERFTEMACIYFNYPFRSSPPTSHNKLNNLTQKRIANQMIIQFTVLKPMNWPVCLNFWLIIQLAPIPSQKPFRLQQLITVTGHPGSTRYAQDKQPIKICNMLNIHKKILNGMPSTNI